MYLQDKQQHWYRIPGGCYVEIFLLLTICIMLNSHRQYVTHLLMWNLLQNVPQTPPSFGFGISNRIKLICKCFNIRMYLQFDDRFYNWWVRGDHLTWWGVGWGSEAHQLGESEWHRAVRQWWLAWLGTNTRFSDELWNIGQILNLLMTLSHIVLRTNDSLTRNI